MSSIACSKSIHFRYPTTINSPVIGMEGRSSVSLLEISSESQYLYLAMCWCALWSTYQLYSLVDIVEEQNQLRATLPALAHDLAMRELILIQTMAHWRVFTLLRLLSNAELSRLICEVVHVLFFSHSQRFLFLVLLYFFNITVNTLDELIESWIRTNAPFGRDMNTTCWAFLLSNSDASINALITKSV